MNNEIQISIEFIPNIKDYVPAVRVCQLLVFRILDIAFSVFFLGMGIWMWVLYARFNWWVVLLFTLAVSSWFNGFGLLMIWLRLQLNPMLRDKYMISIRDSGITYKTKRFEQNMAWDFFYKYCNLEHVICLLYGRCNYSLIPKRAFKSQNDIKQFLRLLKDKFGDK
jgi:hypothetical protein